MSPCLCLFTLLSLTPPPLTSAQLPNLPYSHLVSESLGFISLGSCSQLQGLDTERLDSQVPAALRESPAVRQAVWDTQWDPAWGGIEIWAHLFTHLGLGSGSPVDCFRSVLPCFHPSLRSTVSRQWDACVGLAHQQCSALCRLCIQGGPSPGSVFPPVAPCQTKAVRGPLSGLALHPVALGAAAAQSSGVGMGHPDLGKCCPCSFLSEILRMSFCPFHVCPGLSGLFLKST